MCQDILPGTGISSRCGKCWHCDDNTTVVDTEGAQGHGEHDPQVLAQIPMERLLWPCSGLQGHSRAERLVWGQVEPNGRLGKNILDVWAGESFPVSVSRVG